MFINLFEEVVKLHETEFLLLPVWGKFFLYFFSCIGAIVFIFISIFSVFKFQSFLVLHFGILLERVKKIKSKKENK